MKCENCDTSNADEGAFFQYSGFIVCETCLPKLRIEGLQTALRLTMYTIKELGPGAIALLESNQEKHRKGELKI